MSCTLSLTVSWIEPRRREEEEEEERTRRRREEERGVISP